MLHFVHLKISCPRYLFSSPTLSCINLMQRSIFLNFSNVLKFLLGKISRTLSFLFLFFVMSLYSSTKYGLRLCCYLALNIYFTFSARHITQGSELCVPCQDPPCVARCSCHLSRLWFLTRGPFVVYEKGT